MPERKPSPSPAAAPEAPAEDSTPAAAEPVATTSADTVGAPVVPQSDVKPAVGTAQAPTRYAAGDDGHPKRLQVVGLGNSFGPIEVDGTAYTLTRAGVIVDGDHVAKVREAAATYRVKIHSEALTDDELAEYTAAKTAE